MTIKIKAFQRYGIETKDAEEFEFCCWESLKQWLDDFASLHRCKKCEPQGRNP